MENFEYCTQAAIDEEYENRSVQRFDGIAYLAALFALRRLHLTIEEGYSRKLHWLNQCAPGKAFGKVPRDLFQKWNHCIKGHLPIDRKLFMSSIIGARDREFGVARIKYEMLENSRKFREAPSFFVVDEQIVPYTGRLSGAKKRLPKKTSEGLEYFTIATSNKEYLGYQVEIREETKDSDDEGKILTQCDPVSGGYKLNYILEKGLKYEVGYPSGSKMLGVLMLLIFQLGAYLRYSGSCLVTDSAYSFLEGFCMMSMWGIVWVGSIGIKQRKGFRGLKEIRDTASSIRIERAKKAKKAKKKKKVEEPKKVEKPTFSKDVTIWEMAQKEAKKGSS